MTPQGMTRASYHDMLTRQDKQALAIYVGMRYQNIDGERPNHADLMGLSHDDLVDLIMKVEYPEAS